LAGKNKIIEYTPKIISDAVVAIRKSKLPDPALIGNAGSFFKNVFVDRDKLEEIKKIYPDIPFFEEEENINPVRSRLSQGDRSTRFTRAASNGVKIPAGWLIEKCGWKGKKVGNVGMHEKQALVLINYGGATGEEVKNFSEQIIDSVFSKFGLKLEREVNLI
jgi:UDP-N-acetylmuramate dehydrogenase